MKKYIAKGLIYFSILLSLGTSSVSFGAAMTDYCQVPPFIGTGGEPNILMVNDVSGSMSWSAYGTSDSSSAPPDSGYVSTKGYEGYFDPAKYYKPVDPACNPITASCPVCNPATTDCLYIETTPTGAPCVTTCSETTCVRRQSSCAMGSQYGGGTGHFGCSSSSSKPFGCCTAITTTGDCNLQTGNYLNYHNMHRIDLTRWALTGGRPSTCSGSFSSDRCDPELWDQSGNSASGKIGTVCNNSLDVNGDGAADGGCILQADNGTQVAVPFSRVYDGLAYQFANLLVKPRLGVMSYDSSGVNSNKVFLGDFLASNVNSAAFPYLNLITNINSQNPGGGTPTGPAMWDAFNYYAQKAPQWGGFAAQSGSGDRWKNPLFVCDGGGGNNCVQNNCARNYVLLMSDGDWNYPSNDIGNSPTCTPSSTSAESADPLVPAYCMHKGFTNVATGTATKVSGVYTIGLFMGSSSCGIRAMENTAMYGSFENSARTWPDSRTGFPSGTATCSCTDGTSSGSLCAALPASSPDWDLDADGLPDTFFRADDAINIKQDIMNAVQDILSHATSGTAASVLASGEGSGANLVQATYYPRRKFFDTSISWTGGLQNLWYYIDPTFNNSSIREDDGGRILNLQTDSTHKDYITKFYFDTAEQKAKARLYNSLSGGGAGALVSTIDFEDLSNLWEAGTLLWNRAASDRTIYTPLDTSQALTANANKFSAGAPTPDNTAALRPLLNTDDAAASSTVNNQLAANIVNYVRGTDLADYVYTSGTTTVTESYRPRTVKIDLNNNNNATDTSVVVSGVTMDETVAKVWKLGDIVNSTPKIASWAQLNNYNTKWDDASYNSFISSATYTTRGTVYVGANDGMLHAFKLGTLQYKWSGQNTTREIARLSGADLGKEMWAFIPKNVLPYLKYLKDTDYCHIHTVDLTPFLVDASINMPTGCTGDYWKCAKDVTSWRTILIGGMKLGGACRDTASSCTECVKTPVTGNGYSSYFALDVTDENNPQLLWEFSDPTLGFTTSGPAIVRISSRTVSGAVSSVDGNSTNGKWFVVFGSGPTGPIDTASQKFQGHSDQNLKLFVLDLKTGALVRTIDTEIQNAFAGSMLYTAFDNHVLTSMDYQDQAIYIPYVKKCASTTTYCTADTWTDGGVLRLLTNQDLNGNDVSATGNTALNPGNWVLSTVMSGIGPVTSAVTHLRDDSTGNLWLYFATGRYYYRSPTGSDDPTAQRNLFGIVEPCFSNKKYLGACYTPSSALTRYLSDLSPVSTSTRDGVSTSTGWYINLEGQGTYTYDENLNGTTADDVARSYNAERVITDPVASPSSFAVFFTSFEPYNDLCAIGGKTFIWALKYDTGGSATDYLMGTALIQVSTGSIEQIRLRDAFTQKGNRRTGALEGLPPTTQGLNLMTAPAPVQKVLHKREK
jgi:type IV pilus assembly protein PilY1